MAQTKEGALKIAAAKAGISVAEYLRHTKAGLKRCTLCACWHPVSAFGRDASRWDGMSASCKASRNAEQRAKHVPATRIVGKAIVPARDGDRKQARRRINYFVEAGLIPSPNALPCHDCGHVWKPGGKRHEYDHYAGYAAQNHERVQAVCTTCHHERERNRT